MNIEKTATLNLRVDPKNKKAVEDVMSNFGIHISTAIDICLKKITLKGYRISRKNY